MGTEGQDTIITDVDDSQKQQIKEGEEQPVVQEEERDGVVAKTSPSQREQAMQRILERREAEQRAEFGDDVFEEKAADPAEPKEKPRSQEPADDRQDVFKLKVDGQEIVVPREKVIDSGIRALQKESAADKRLAEAAAKEAQLTARAKELARMEAELLSKRDRQEGMEPDETGRKFADALFTDEEEVAKTITKITKKLAEVEGKVEKVHRTEEEKRQQAFGDAVKHYHTAHETIASDPDLHLVFNNSLKRVAAENPSLNPTQVVDKAAEHVYSKFGVKRPGAEPPPPAQETRGTERQRAKQNMPAPIKRASARVPPPAPPKQKSASDVLDDMRKTRGPRAW